MLIPGFPEDAIEKRIQYSYLYMFIASLLLLLKKDRKMHSNVLVYQFCI